MWTYDEKQLKEKNLPGMTIKESACYECKIERAEPVSYTHPPSPRD